MKVKFTIFPSLLVGGLWDNDDRTFFLMLGFVAVVFIIKEKE